MTSQIELRPTQQKAQEICDAIRIRPYCKKVHFLVYNLTNPNPDGDCHSNNFIIFGDAVAFLLEMQQFFTMPMIDTVVIRQLKMNGKKQMTITNKKSKERFKLTLTTEVIEMKHYDYFKNNFLWKKEPLSL